MRVVIVGAGFAGLSAARALCKADAEVVLVDRNNHHLFQALLYQVASAGLSPAEVATPIRPLLRHQKNLKVLMGELTAVHPDRREIELDHRTSLSYDYLILALGVRTSYFGSDAWARYAPGLKSAAEAVRVRESVLVGFEKAESETDPAERERLMTTVVVGGGPTGVELAGAFAELRRNVLRWDYDNIRAEEARVVLIEAGPRLLAGYSERLSRKAEAHLASLGVEVRVGERVTDVQSHRVRTQQGEIAAQTIVWTAGVRGTEMTARLGFDLDRVGRVSLGSDLKLCDRVYCAGDMAHVDQDGKPLPGVAPVAMGEGAHAAGNVLREMAGQPPLPFRYRFREDIATLGRSAAVFQWGRVELTGFPAWFAWLWLHLWRIADLQNRLLVFSRWTWAYFAWKWGVRLILGKHEPSSGQQTHEARQSEDPAR
ncbi:MAG: NAD(P)/FAD-dependent oxidoreductase [Candidatus Eremiobacterota bacterium]